MKGLGRICSLECGAKEKWGGKVTAASLKLQIRVPDRWYERSLTLPRALVEPSVHLLFQHCYVRALADTVTSAR